MRENLRVLTSQSAVDQGFKEAGWGDMTNLTFLSHALDTARSCPS